MPTFGTKRAFSPSEAISAQYANIPDVVYDAVNQLLARGAALKYITLRKDEVIDLAMSLDTTLERRMFFDNHWLDFEPAYRQQGWKVNYESPDRGDTHNGYWDFQR